MRRRTPDRGRGDTGRGPARNGSAPRAALLRAFAAGLAVAALAPGGAPEPAALAAEPAPELVATGIPRPLQLVLDGRTLIVLSPGAPGSHAAGELFRVDLDGPLPVDLGRQPRLHLPFPDVRQAALGSLALDPRTRQLYLGEENGTRIYRLSREGRLTLYATGLRRLAGGSTLAFDRLGRLLVVDYADPVASPAEERALPELEPFRE